MRLKLFFTLLLSAMLPAMAQNAVVTGSVIDADTGSPVSGAVITIADQGITVTTGPAGDFRISNARPGEALIQIVAPGYDNSAAQLQLFNGQSVDAGVMRMFADQPSNVYAEEITLDNLFDETMLDDESSTQQTVVALTGASDDIFYKFARYGYSPLYSTYRGYGSQWSETYLNGVPMNDLIRGGFSFSQLGGMTSRAFRNSTASVGMAPAAFGFGNIGGAQNFNTITEGYAAGFNASVSYTNSNYMLRAMATYSTGLNDKGWAFTVSAIGRYANEGVVPGTFYNAGGLFISAEKVFNRHHSLTLTAYGAPMQYANGRTVVQEAYDLVGDNLYNPTWGWQDGKKRSNNIREKFDPTVMLNYIYKNERTTVNTAIATRWTHYGSTGISFYNAPNPDPVYYQKLPSYWYDVQNNASAGDFATEMWKNDDAARQINWDALYSTNYAINAANANRTEADKQGAAYMQYKSHSNQFNLILNSLVNHRLNDVMTMQAGLSYNFTKTADFQTVKDLLGGEFWYNWNTFGDRDMYDPAASVNLLQNNLNNPDQRVKEGDVVGYDYNIYAMKVNGWLQNQIHTAHWDVNYGVQMSYEQFYRYGHYRTGIAPDNSFGKSATVHFNDAAAKAGATYKINGRNFITANVQYGTYAPVISDVYLSPRVKDTTIGNPNSARVLSASASYIWNYRRFRGAITGYITDMTDATECYGFYDESYNSYMNFTLSGVHRRYAGVELGMSYNITPDLKASFAGTFSRYQYKNNPMGTRSMENGLKPDQTRQVFLKNYYCTSTPQTALNIALNWNAPKRWFLELNASWLADYYERLAYPYHEVIPGLAGYTSSEAELQSLINQFAEQHKLKNNWVMNASVGKLIYIQRKYSLNLNLSVSNILNNRNLITNAVQQSRVDTKNYNPQAYPTKYQYAQGIKVFLNVGFRF